MSLAPGKVFSGYDRNTCLWIMFVKSITSSAEYLRLGSNGEHWYEQVRRDVKKWISYLTDDEIVDEINRLSSKPCVSKLPLHIEEQDERLKRMRLRALNNECKKRGISC